MKLKKVLLKLSGEVLGGREGFGIDPETVREIAAQIGEIRELGTEIAIVIGGGNIFRGKELKKKGLDDVTGDYMGMLATVMNALALQNMLEEISVPTRVQSALKIERMAEPFVRRKALKHLENGRVVLFACGTGNPFFTTDTAAAVRAREIGADALLKATDVDGVYDSDPAIDKNAQRYDVISYAEAIEKNLGVMDTAAFSVCKDGKIPIIVFDINKQGNLKKVILGERIGTIVS